MTVAPPDIITRDRARALGLTRYFTGEPCKHGHVAERWMSGGRCTACRREWRAANLEKVKERDRERARRCRAADPERARERGRKWRAANLELAREGDRERKRLHYAKNKDRILSERAAKRAADPEKAREYLRVWRAANKDKISKGQAAQRRAARAGSELNGAGLTAHDGAGGRSPTNGLAFSEMSAPVSSCHMSYCHVFANRPKTDRTGVLSLRKTRSPNSRESRLSRREPT